MNNQGLFDSFRERSTIKTMFSPEIPRIDPHVGKRLYNIGDMVKMSSHSILRSTSLFEITDWYVTPTGYYMYMLKGDKRDWREMDLEKI